MDMVAYVFEYQEVSHFTVLKCEGQKTILIPGKWRLYGHGEIATWLTSVALKHGLKDILYFTNDSKFRRSDLSVFCHTRAHISLLNVFSRYFVLPNCPEQLSMGKINYLFQGKVNRDID